MRTPAQVLSGAYAILDVVRCSCMLAACMVATHPGTAAAVSVGPTSVTDAAAAAAARYRPNPLGNPRKPYY
jgi:hypothetical protein